MGAAEKISKNLEEGMTMKILLGFVCLVYVGGRRRLSICIGSGRGKGKMRMGIGGGKGFVNFSFWKYLPHVDLYSVSLNILILPRLFELFFK